MFNLIIGSTNLSPFIPYARLARWGINYTQIEPIPPNFNATSMQLDSSRFNSFSPFSPNNISFIIV